MTLVNSTEPICGQYRIGGKRKNVAGKDQNPISSVSVESYAAISAFDSWL